MILPEGTTLPPIPYLVVLLVGIGAVSYALYRESVSMTGRTVVALSTWMVVGAAFHVLYQVGAVPGVLEPLFGSPSVYGLTFVIAGVVWLLALRTRRPLLVLSVVGGLLALLPLGVALRVGLARGTIAPAWPIFGVVISAIIASLTWQAFRRLVPAEAAAAGMAGALAIFAHVLDGVTTAIGIDVLQYAEKTPLSLLVLDVAGALPTATIIGVGWLFVLVKLIVAVLVVWLLGDFVREEPTEGNALLLLVTAVGLGPAVHNVILFTVLGPMAA